jgi:ketosteroid isomerase-like protein
MKKIIQLILVSQVLLLTSCSAGLIKTAKEELKTKIKLTENNFQKTLIEKGAAEAFYLYAADNAVIKRENDTLIVGKEAIKKYYSSLLYKNAIAQWEPDYIDISEDGTMAYTFGKYRWTITDSDGEVTIYKGVFHTVWKREPDGSWKYVWD